MHHHPLISALREAYPNAQCALQHETPFQLLVATILSAQCTDQRVNQTTQELFKYFPTPTLMAQAKINELERLLKNINFYRNKAKAIQKTSQILVDQFNAQVPREMEDLIRLQGVGRKTANVVRGIAFDIPSIVVDTHVGRIAQRLGLSQAQTPVEIEKDLEKQFPKTDWTQLALLMIAHGRACCKAARPRCLECALQKKCPQRKAKPLSQSKVRANRRSSTRPSLNP